MSLTASDSGGSLRPPIPAGTTIGLCCGVYDLGTQRTTWNDEVKETRQVLLMFELPEHSRDFGGGPEPSIISSTFTLSLGPKAKLRHFLEGWRGRPFTQEELTGFHLGKLIGIAGLLGITHAITPRGVYANVSSAVPLPRTMHAPMLTRTPVAFEIESILKGPLPDMPPFVAKKVKSSLEFRRWAEGKQEAEEDEAAADEEVSSDDTPF